VLCLEVEASGKLLLVVLAVPWETSHQCLFYFTVNLCPANSLLHRCSPRSLLIGLNLSTTEHECLYLWVLEELQIAL
jgi:hypothetical protein